MTPIQEKICTILGWRWYCFSYHRHGMRGGVWVHRCVSFEQHHPKKGARPSKFKNVRLATPRDFSHPEVNFWEPNYDSIPKFETDLNAMHAAESTLKHPEAYASRLGAILQADKSASCMDGTTAWHFAFAHATAAQRAQAFLLTHKSKPKKRK